jgi:hypothetical protein
MKLTARSRSTFLLFLGLGFLIGSLAWEVLERILAEAGVELALGVGPVGFDLSVLKMSVKVNPGTLLGVLGSVVLFRFM